MLRSGTNDKFYESASCMFHISPRPTYSWFKSSADITDDTVLYVSYVLPPVCAVTNTARSSVYPSARHAVQFTGRRTVRTLLLVYCIRAIVGEVVILQSAWYGSSVHPDTSLFLVLVVPAILVPRCNTVHRKFREPLETSLFSSC